jgi:hypothetical protein
MMAAQACEAAVYTARLVRIGMSSEPTQFPDRVDVKEGTNQQKENKKSVQRAKKPPMPDIAFK